MDKELARKLAEYLLYLTNLPETRMNNSLIDCVLHIMQTKPDTEGSLNGQS